MNRDELLVLREKLLMGDPPYEENQFGDKVRKGGTPGLRERKTMGGYDVNASGVALALQACLELTQHLLDRMRKP